MRSDRLSRFLVFLLLACVACAAPAQTRVWSAATLSNAPETIRFRDAKDNLIAEVRPQLLQQLLVVQERIQQKAGYVGELVITNGAGPNAFAFVVEKRSVVGITLPMLDLLGDDLDAYAALFGHEVAHHVSQHAATRTSRETGLVVAGAIVAALLGAAGVQGGGAIADIGTTLIGRSYSREEEREADRLGVEWMAAAGFDPEGAVRLHQKMLAAAKGGAIPFLSSHPSGEERIAGVRQQIAALAPSDRKAAAEIRAWVAQSLARKPAEYAPEVKEGLVRGLKAFREKDYAAARKEFAAVAETGHPEGQANMGYLYDNGFGVPQDHARAAEWYRKAAEQGNRVAQNGLGALHEKGLGVPQDFTAAADWYRKAANQGHTAALNNLGVLYLKGSGVQADPAAAYVWFSLAAARGHPVAAKHKRDIGGKLDAETLARAEKTVREWTPAGAPAEGKP